MIEGKMTELDRALIVRFAESWLETFHEERNAVFDEVRKFDEKLFVAELYGDSNEVKAQITITHIDVRPSVLADDLAKYREDAEQHVFNVPLSMFNDEDALGAKFNEELRSILPTSVVSIRAEAILPPKEPEPVEEEPEALPPMPKSARKLLEENGIL